MLTFPSTPSPRATPAARPRRAPKINRLPRTLKFNSDFFSHISAHASDSWRHSHPAVTFLSGVSIVTSLNDTSGPRAREHLRSCLHLTNPCDKRKVLNLTKPKGKKYKTKSLGHFITVGGVLPLCRDAVDVFYSPSQFVLNISKVKQI